MRNDSEIISYLQNKIYKNEFKTMSVESINTGKADKYGTVKHNIFARTEWNDGTVTQNAFSVNEDSDGILFD